jgi:invasion protein IalB
MAEDNLFKKIPPIAYIAAVLLLVLIAGFSYYLGKKQSAEPTVAGTSAPIPASKFARLPPERFGNWNLVCGETPQKVKRCSLALDAVNKDKRPVLGLRLVRNQRGQALLVVITPPGAILSAGVRVAPEGGKELVAQFIRCGQGACQAVAVFDDASASTFAAASTLHVKFVAGNGKPVALKIPNAGFDAAYPKWLETMPAPAAATAPPAAATPPADATPPPASEASPPAGETSPPQ